MEMIETNFRTIPEGFEHRVEFEFESRRFLALVIETQDETFIRDCYFIDVQLVAIDIPKYFGDFKGDVYYFIYENIQKGFPIEEKENHIGIE